MKASDVPVKFPVPFGTDAGSLKNAIPDTSQIGITDGAASFQTGFVPLNNLPVAAGGVPPSIQDMNGILFDATGWNQWTQAGGPVKWDSAFSATIGGYPAGAIVASASVLGRLFLCLTDDNTTDPDAAGAGWTVFQFGTLPATGAQLQYVSATQIKVAPKAGGYIWINGFNYQVPSDIVLDNTGLVFNTVYYAYVAIVASAMVLELSTTGYTLNANGIPQKAADQTRTCVGMLYTSVLAQFQSGALTLSYFNRRKKSSGAGYSGAVVSQTATALLDPCAFLCWGDEDSDGLGIGSANNNNAGVGASSFFFVDGVSAPGSQNGTMRSTIANEAQMVVCAFSGPLAEGVHVAQIYGTTSTEGGPTAFFVVGATLNVRVMG